MRLARRCDIIQQMAVTTLPIAEILPEEVLSEFCYRWQVAEVALFGSVLRDDFAPDSDVDVLVTLAPNIRRGLFDWEKMRSELEKMTGRKIDLVSRESLELSRDRKRRNAILESARVIHVER